MLKIEDKSSLLVFRNTKGEKVFYSVSIDSEVKDKEEIGRASCRERV